MLFLNVATLKIKIIIIVILLTDWPEIILSSARTTKNLVAFALSIFSVYYTIKMIIKNQVLLIVSSLSVKKFKVNFGQIKQPSLRWRVPCSIQNGNNLRHSFDVKKAKETLTTRLSGNKKHLLNWEVLKPTGFENSPKCPASCPSHLHLVVSSLHRQADFLWHFPTKKSTYWRYNGSQSSGNEEGQMNGRS